jgi:hypothetical protein
MNKFTITILISFFLFACNLIEEKEIGRIESPDGKVVAVMIESDGGATTSYGYSIYIIPKGGSIEKKNKPVFLSDHTRRLRFNWDGPKRLKILYAEARIFRFTNFWQHRDVDNFKYEVKIMETEQNL